MLLKAGQDIYEIKKLWKPTTALKSTKSVEEFIQNKRSAVM